MDGSDLVNFFASPILAIESSCDETAAAVVVGRQVLSNVINSQIEMHRKWGGVVPEAAARAHVESILPVVDEALALAGIPMNLIGAVAATNRPGLIGALSVGATAAKSLAWAKRLPFLGIHHLEGHIWSVLSLNEVIPCPHIAMIVSGGHTESVLVSAPGEYRIVGQTIDDAAGEAFDKASRLLGLGYPGGLAIQNAAVNGDPRRYALPRGLSGDTLDFSFSGLKTAVLRLVEKEGSDLNIPDAAASVQNVIVNVIVERGIRAAERNRVGAMSLVGGVSANKALREKFASACDKNDLSFFVPPMALCTDNAAMIGLAASIRLANGESSPIDLDVFATAEL